jgi:predicted RNase H-like HicB family nuclease
MDQKFTILIEKEDKFYIAKCIELKIVSQGTSYGKALDNIKEAIELYLENEPKLELKDISLATIVVKK